MQIFKKLLRGSSSLAFKFFVLVLAIVAALVMTFNSPKKIEKSLSDSGVYNTFVSGALQEVQKSNSKDKSSGKHDDIPIYNPAVVDAANKAFTPQLLQTTTENVLDGTYDWLSGKTATPTFRIDFVEAKKTFAQKVGAAAQKRLASLPKCTTAQAKLQGTNIDPFAATCTPKGIKIKVVSQKAANDLATSKDFLGTPLLTAANMSKDKNGQTAFDKLSNAPRVYKAINASPWLLSGLALLSGVITIALYDSKRRGLRNLSIALTITGAILLLITLAAAKGFERLSQPNGKLTENIKGSFQQTIIKALGSISGEIEHVLMWFGIAYMIIGICTLIALHFNQPMGKESDIAKSESESPSTDKKSVPKVTPKPTPKPKTVQG